MTEVAQQALTQKQLEQMVAQRLAQRVKRDDIIREVIRTGKSTPEAMQLVTQVKERGVQPTAKPATGPRPAAAQTGPRATSAPAARKPVANQQNAGVSDDASRGRSMMIWGFATCAAGTVLTIGGHMMTAPGNTYIAFYGAMIFGLIRGTTGLVIYLKNR